MGVGRCGVAVLRCCGVAVLRCCGVAVLARVLYPFLTPQHLLNALTCLERTWYPWIW
ncbi:hypothetical protein OP10G_1705 [Fimbriimonas ginsengisoli Gsoil 348]|uniref:Uncharacterized protein n=1 Tax=Fimbriimonas ginsengisoli Gsoil 348 TaxID=661478 RepID=A0A068NNF6_FIMGI|nr:hypothetical protein OP10G_1705 [Fimbriimonas ginsengisoli Gsoil 348]